MTIRLNLALTITGITLAVLAAPKTALSLKQQPELPVGDTLVTQQIAQTEVPITSIVFPRVGLASLTVPNYDTTRPAYGGRLRLYDVHLAKMFEVTHFECNRSQGGMVSDGRIMWRYYAGDGEVNMGAFDISCRLANQIVREYGLGQTEATRMVYYRAPVTENVPILDITGDKVPRWIDFSVSFRPEFPD
jgi:serine/threonine-protein kinase